MAEKLTTVHVNHAPFVTTHDLEICSYSKC